MKKLKGNSILAIFVFGLCLLVLCAFGTDSCYIILSRYKLQKITEAIAIEYISSIKRDDSHILAGEDLASGMNEIKNQIEKRYDAIYNTGTSGIFVFNIEDASIKTNDTTKEAVVKVQTTSRVLPAFLRFIGVQNIIVHANAYAKISPVEIKTTLNKTHVEGEEWSFDSAPMAGGLVAEFSFPTKTNGVYINAISGRSENNDDFEISLSYQSAPEETAEGGEEEGAMAASLDGMFFVFAGYQARNGVKWMDITSAISNKSNVDLLEICSNTKDAETFQTGETPAGTENQETGETEYAPRTDLSYNTTKQCFHCIKPSSGKTARFNLSKLKAETSPDELIGRITNLRIYKAGKEGSYDSYDSDKSEVKLNILNNISLIKKRDFDRF